MKAFFKTSPIFITTFLIFMLILSCSKLLGQSSNSVKYVPFVEDGLWGLANYEGDVIFEPQWEKVLTERVQSMHELGLFSFLNSKEGIYVVHAPSKTIRGPYVQVRRTWLDGMNCRVGKKKGFVNSKGELIIPTEFRDIYTNRITNHIILTRNDGSQALTTLNTKFPEKFPYKSLKAVYFHDDTSIGFLGMRNGRWGLLDSKIEVVIPFAYKKIQKLGNRNRPQYLLCSKEDALKQWQATIFKQDGTELFTTTSTHIRAHSSHLFSIFENHKGWKITDQRGIPISSEYFSLVEWLPERDAESPQILKTETTLGKRMYFDKLGVEIPIKEAQTIIEKHRNGPQLNGLIIVENKDKHKGVTNVNGDTIIKLRYHHVKFVGDCIAVNKYNSDNRLNVMLFDQKGKMLYDSAKNIKQIYLDYSRKSYPLIQIKSSKGTHYRKLDGSDILRTNYQIAIPETISDDKTGEYIPLIKVKVNNKWGYTDFEGAQIIEPKYDNIRHLMGAEIFIITHNGKDVVINSNGKIYSSR